MYANNPYDVALYMQSVLIIYCFLCKVPALCTACVGRPAAGDVALVDARHQQEHGFVVRKVAHIQVESSCTK